MNRSMLRLAAAAGAVLFAAACAQNPESPVSPSAAAGASAANPDGSTLKVSAPTPTAPEEGAVLPSRRPSVTFNNAVGRFTNVALSYRVQLFNGAGNGVGEVLVPQGSGSQTTVDSEADLDFDTEYRWRVRAEFEGQSGPWSVLRTFKTPPRVVIGNGGNIGPPRNIFINEAQDIIIAIYTAGRFNLGSSSTREQRNLYLDAAVAAIHYGHGKWNPQGPDNNWCIKNGGPGRPQADDVIVLCSSRDAWDLVLSIGANSWNWHQEYIGKLPSVQFVYPPDAGAMRILP